MHSLAERACWYRGQFPPKYQVGVGKFLEEKVSPEIREELRELKAEDIANVRLDGHVFYEEEP